MILVILGICIAIIIGGIVLANKMYDETLGYVLVALGTIGVAVCLIVIGCLAYDISELKVIDEKIEMYQEENVKIESDLAEAVAKYQEYESGIIASVAPDSSVALVSLYPELKADTLIQKQIEVYIENNNKIKGLKEEKISGSVVRWWLYFGG